MKTTTKKKKTLLSTDDEDDGEDDAIDMAASQYGVLCDYSCRWKGYQEKSFDSF
jgi:hypothetical protein